APEELFVVLRPTRQRYAALPVIGVGAAGVVVCAVLGGAALAQQGDATSLNDKRATVPLTPAERDRYNGAVTSRDHLISAATVTGGLSALTLATGLALFAFDKPEMLPANDERVKAPRRP